MRVIKNIFWIPIIIFLVLCSSYSGYRLAFRSLIFPKVSISGIDVGGMDKITALSLVQKYFSKNPNNLLLRIKGEEISKLNEIKIERDFNWAAEQAFMVGRNGNLVTQFLEQMKTLFASRNVLIAISYDKEELSGYVDQLATEYDQKTVWPKIILENGKPRLVKGQDGIKVNKHDLINKILMAWSLPEKQIVDVPVEIVSARENDQLVERAISSMNKWEKKKLTLKQGDFQIILDQEKLAGLFGLVSGVVDNNQFENLLTEIQQQVETNPKDAVFKFENGKVKEFRPEVVGKQINIPLFNDNLAKILIEANTEVLEIPMILTSPKIKTGDINNLGIKELIGQGKSSFLHSIPGRVFNVNLASSKINGFIVAPGEEFSFNQAVGDISRDSGYQRAYIISGGKTVLGDGGGVCQVSTTVFRAALNAGLPITERKAHAYRVGYYEQDNKPGIDATVYNPSADLKFLNSTGNYILIQTSVDTKKLKMTVDIYGTKDGRVAILSEPKIYNQVPPPSTLYIEDPTLPVGQTKQIDFSAWGARVSFDYKVIKGVETIFEKTFYSNYQPWQAIYLRGTRS